MAWIESRVELGDHPKIYTLLTVLGVRRAEAVGLVHLLWHFTMKFAWRDGDLKKFSTGVVEKSCGWEGEPNKLIKALQKSGFLDDMQVHDWKDFAGRLIYDRIYNEKKRRKNTVKTPSNGVKVPSTVPYRTVPNHTLPNTEDVRSFFLEKRSNTQEAERFFNYYESNGWKVGRNSMRNWKAAAAGWISRNGGTQAIATNKSVIKKCYICTAEITERDWPAHYQKHKDEQDKGPAPDAASNLIKELSRKKET